jgi:hypothetical protein
LVDASSLSSSASVEVQFRGVSVPPCVRVSDQLPEPVLGHTVAARHRRALYHEIAAVSHPVSHLKADKIVVLVRQAKLLETVAPAAQEFGYVP